MWFLSLLITAGFIFFLYRIASFEERERVSIVFKILYTALLFIIFLSLLSFSDMGPERNLGGILGHVLAGFLFRNLGVFFSYFFVVLLLASGVLMLLRKYTYETARELTALIVSLFVLSPLLQLFGLWRGNGKVPSFLYAVLRKYLGAVGSGILLTAIIMAAFLWAFRIPLPSIHFRRRKKKLEVEDEEIGGGTILEPRTIDEAPEPPVERKPVLTGRKPRTRSERRKKEKAEPSIKEDLHIPQTELLSLLKEPVAKTEADIEECRKNAKLIESKLEEFGVIGKVIDFHPGPVVTRYEYEPAPGIKLSKIVNLADDLALRMKSNKIRIVAPLPEKGLIGIEVPNKKRRIVYFRELAEHEGFKKLKSKLGFALGVDTAGRPVYADLAKMPHLLIAGATGSGKSVCINTILTSILFRADPREVRFLLIDPKRIELSYYEGIPHLLRPVVKDRKAAALALKQAIVWMDLRYKHFARDGVRDIESHNRTLAERNEEPLPYIVIIIDEFADLILTIGKEIEEPLARLAQMARAVGIHLVVATQRPSVDVITGMIKANFPVRIAFKVPSKFDSRTILDESGAEKLLGKGDMLFIPPGTAEPLRLHGPFISEEETRKIAQSFTKEYLKFRLTELIGDRPGLDAAVDEIVERGYISAITRSDEPGTEEKLERITEILVEEVEMEEDEVRDALSRLRENYYVPIQEMAEAPIPEPEEEERTVETNGLDPLLVDAAKLVVLRKSASATMLQRKLKIGFARAARIMDQLEQLGVIGPQEGSKPRKVLIGDIEELNRMFGEG